jgi:zinc and cadmium transporter
LIARGHAVIVDTIRCAVSPTLTLVVYCLAVVLASLAGGWLPMLVRLTHKRMEMALSFVSGVMLGVAGLLLLPHAFAARIEAADEPASLGTGHAHDLSHDLLAPVMLWMLVGFLAMFIIERFFCFHHHAAPADSGATSGSAGCAHEHHHAHHAHHDHDHEGHAPPAAHALRWSGAAVGMALHSLLDGVAIAASVAAAHQGETGVLAGLGAFLVVLLHKPFDALTIATLMAAGRQSPGNRHAVNLAFALLTPAGAALFMLGLAGSGQSQALVLSIALAFAAGTFLCIALSDVLPELQFHQHDRVKLSAALMLGLALAWGVAEIERRLHVHEHEDAAISHEDHDH